MRLLILAYDFPPNTSVGAQRPYGWFKYLKLYGIEPVVVTRHWDEVRTPEDTIRPCGSEVTVTASEEGTVIRVPYHPNLRDRMLLRFGDRFALVRKMLSLWFMLGQYFVKWADNRRNILDAARAHLNLHPVDAIIATGEPFVLFSYASQLSAEFNVPWVADYRDGWSMNYHSLGNGRMTTVINEQITKRVEQKVVSSASMITAAARSLKDECCQLFPLIRAHVVMNGFFEEMFNPEKPASSPSGSPFTIIHSGTLYPYQPVEIFLDGLKLNLLENSISPDRLQVVFLGMEYQDSAKKRILKHAPELKAYLSFTERLPHQEAIAVQQRADMLLLLANPDFGQIYAKLFDYIALDKKVLVCQNDRGPVEQIMKEIGTALFADTPQDVSHTLTRMMTSGENTIEAPTEKRRKYSRRHQTGILAGLLKDITTK
jgi:hypothetical protein